MKSTQRTMCSLVPCAKAGARRAARMPSSPPRADTAAVPARKVRRESDERWGVCAESRMRSSLSEAGTLSGLVDLLQLALGPLDGLFGSQPLDALGEHVDEDVLGQRLGGLAAGGAGVADLARVLQRLREDGGLGILPPQRMVLVGARPRDPEGVHDLEVLVVLGTVHVVTDEVLRKFLVLSVLHHAAVPGGEPVEAAGGPGRVVAVVRPLVDVGELPAGGDVDAGGVAGERDLLGQEGAVVVAVVPG